jgi:ABC-type uncharacterized transport system involved in gliding motility auxiliary subunit
MVVHPKDLPEKTVYAIDQYLMKGGKALVFVDPHCMFDRPPRDPQNPFGGAGQKQSSNLEKLFAAWGLSMPAEQFAGDLALAPAIAASMAPGAKDTVRFVGLQQFKRDRDVFNKAEVSTTGLQEVEVYFPGVLKKERDVGLEVVPLIRTTGTGNTWTAAAYELGGPMGPNIEGLTDKFQPGSERLWVAARLTGKFKSAFEAPPGAPKPEEAKAEDGAAKEGEADKTAEDTAKAAEAAKPEDAAKADETAKAEESAKAADAAKTEAKPEAGADGKGEAAVADASKKTDSHLVEGQEPTSVIVIADVDMISDPAAYQNMFGLMSPKNSNSALVMNALDQLSGSTDLVRVRSRGKFKRPFTVVDEIEAEADQRTRDKIRKINEEIRKFETELSDLDAKATDENVGLLQNTALQKQRDTEIRIREKRRELREVQKDKIAAIESMGNRIKNLNRIVIPFLVLAGGVYLGVARYKRRRVTVTGGVS